MYCDVLRGLIRNQFLKMKFSLLWGQSKNFRRWSVAALHVACGIVDAFLQRHSSFAESAEKPLWETRLAEPYPGAVAQGGVPAFA